MIEKDFLLLQQLTAPYARSNAHVQGPGGNTSIKSADGSILIKASGFTFKDLADGNGVVWLENEPIIDNLVSKRKQTDSVFESVPPVILDSIPEGLKPSMEFEFHSILDTCVLHTHSVYANVLNCSQECEDILQKLFKPGEYVVVPYLTPGFPIAAWLMNNLDRGTIPPVIFLKNHGIIVHGDTVEEVLTKYNFVEAIIRKHLDFPILGNSVSPAGKIEREILPINFISGNDFENILLNQTLIPDQSVFFRGKVSSQQELETGIFRKTGSDELTIAGPEKFIEAAKGMLEAVYYIREQIARLGFTPVYIPESMTDIIHGLAIEKYRVSMLKK